MDVQLHSFLDLGTRMRWVVSFTPRSLYRQGKSPWYPLDRRFGGPHSRSGRGGKEKSSQPQPGLDPYNPDRPARSPALYWLSYHICQYTERLHVIKMREGMRSIRLKLRRPSIPSEPQLNRAVLFRTRFTTIWRSGIHISLNDDADAFNRRRHRFLLRCTIHHICQGHWAWVYDIWNVKNKIQNSSNCYRQYLLHTNLN
jgi:hypothetical protein